MSEKFNPFEKSIRRDAKLLDRTVTELFKPIAIKHGLQLIRIQDGIYEIPSPYFILHIEAYAGHSSRGLSVSLRQTSLCSSAEKSQDGQYGIGWLMRFNNVDVKSFNFPINDDEDFIKMAKLYADATERFGIPYLLGLKDDFKEVSNYVEQENGPAAEKMRQMQQNIEHNMKNVRQEWPVVISREEGEEWDTVKEITPTNIQFLGDLVGEKERMFKEQIAKLFSPNEHIEKAYLARIVGPGFQTAAALCLRAKCGFGKDVRQSLGKIFANTFGLQNAFNLFFVNDEQEVELQRVCKPFYQRQNAII